MAEPENEMTVAVLLCPRQVDKFAHDADVLEPFKRLVLTDEHGMLTKFVMRLRPPAVDDARRCAVLGVVRDALTSQGVYRVLACFIPGQPGGWRDETCTHVSTGRKWTALDPLLAAWGFVGEPAPQAQPEPAEEVLP